MVAVWFHYAAWTLLIIILVGINLGLYAWAAISWDDDSPIVKPIGLALAGVLMTAALIGWGVQSDADRPPCARWGPTVMIPSGKVMVPHRACEEYYVPVEGGNAP